MSPPTLPPGYEKHHIVFLEAVHLKLPELDFPYTLEAYDRTSPDQIASRIKKATIIVAILLPILPEHLEHAPHLQLLIILATGMGWVDRPVYAARNIAVLNCPQSNIESVSEHFLTLYFSSRRKIPEVTRLTTETDEWKTRGTLTSCWTQGPPLSCAKEILGIVGYGSLGKKIESLAKAVGFGKIIIADRKGQDQPREGRTAFTDFIKTASTIVLCCPKEKDTIDLIGAEEFKLMRKDCLIINVARGGIVNEQALADALKEGQIFAAATDVMDSEPCSPGSSPLVPDVGKGEKPIPNLIITPHVAWFAERTIEMLLRLFVDGIEAFAHGRLEEDYIQNSVQVYKGKVLKY